MNDWYIDVQDPPKDYQIDIGYAAPDGKFVTLARSNVVSTPPLGSANSTDGNWAEVARDCDRIYAARGYDRDIDSSQLKALFEERLRRPMGVTTASRFGLTPGCLANPSVSFPLKSMRNWSSSARPNPAESRSRGAGGMQADGTFVVRFNLPDRPSPADRGKQHRRRGNSRTVVLAVERNTKVMEPMTRESE